MNHPSRPASSRGGKKSLSFNREACRNFNAVMCKHIQPQNVISTIASNYRVVKYLGTF